jgi:hypothetical protein
MVADPPRIWGDGRMKNDALVEVNTEIARNAHLILV